MVMSFPTDQSTFYILKQIATLNSDFISEHRQYFTHILNLELFNFKHRNVVNAQCPPSPLKNRQNLVTDEKKHCDLNIENIIFRIIDVKI